MSKVLREGTVAIPTHTIKIVDLKQSKVDWDKSNPEKGEYVFKDKVIIDYRSDKAALPDHKVQWGRNAPNDLSHWIYTLNYTPVNVSEKHYWPEGFTPDAEGHYVNGDGILMQCPALLYAERRKKELEKSRTAPRKTIQKFKDETKRAGISVEDIDPSDLLRG